MMKQEGTIFKKKNFNSFFFFDLVHFHSPRRIQCLKYLVLANMLMLSDINPFVSGEAAPYKDDEEIVAMTSLVTAYENKDIKAFEKILKENQKTIMEDSFMKDYIDDLRKNMKSRSPEMEGKEKDPSKKVSTSAYKP